MAKTESTTIEISRSTISRPTYTEDGDFLVVRFPNTTADSYRATMAEQIEAITCLMTANDGEDFRCLNDELQLTIRHMLANMSSELNVLCSE